MNMSFIYTTEQVRNRTKTVTRRGIGTWKNLKPGDRLNAVEKGMGLKKGEKVKVLAVIEVVSVRVEALCSITPLDVVAEGFPSLTRGEFVMCFCDGFGCTASDRVRRIEFKYVDSA